MNRAKHCLAVGVLAALAALSGCTPTTAGGTPPAVVSAEPDAKGAPAKGEELPPLTVPPPLPPAPVPATFDVAELAGRVTPTVVNITTTQKVNLPAGHPLEFFMGPDGPVPPGERTGAGTGFIIDPVGYIVTNEHVVEGADTVSVRLADEREFPAKVVGRDPKLDLALLKLEGLSEKLPAVQLGSSDSLRIGESVLAVGNPFGLGHTVTLGIVSAKSRVLLAGPYDDFIQTDASINPGNSGGPLFNWRGEVVGINTAIRPGANNIGFAIPVDALKGVLKQLRDDGHVTRGKLGLSFQAITKELATALKVDSTKGALVAYVEPGGSAARAGIKAGDLVVSVNGVEILHAEELPRNVAKNAPGAKVKVALMRDGKKLELTATLDRLEDETLPPPDKPAAPPVPSDSRLGIKVSNARGEGVRVDAVSPGTAVREIRPGDVLLEVDGKTIKDTDQLEKLLSAAKPGATLLAKVRRGDATRFIPIPIPK